MRYKNHLVLFFVLLATLATPLISASIVHADIADLTVETGCDPDNLPSYTGSLELPPQQYDAYVRLSKRGEQAQVIGYVQTGDSASACQKLGELTASGDRWSKLGQFSSPQAQEYVLQLSSPALDKLPDANRPAIMLVPHDNPICVPDVECEVSVNGEKGYVRPTGTLLNQNSLHILEVSDPAGSEVKIVRYYVDDKLVYTTPTLTAFDLKYASYPKQKLTRAVEYTSGQQVVLNSLVPSTYQDSFSNLVFRTGQSYPKLFTTLLIIVGVLLIVGATVSLLRALWHHRNWEYNHGLLQKQPHELTEHQRQLILKQQSILKGTKVTVAITLALCGIVGAILLANTYLAQIFTVDGVSMQNTRFTGDRMLINKIPVSLASTNSREYVPKRGDVVVARAVFGSSALISDDTSDIFIIKRVIGLPGEHLVIKDGVITIYNNEHPEGFNPDKGSSWESKMVPNAKDEQLNLVLGSSELFLSGDNRPESIDSRFNGPIATKEIIGKASVKLWPIGKSKPADLNQE